MPFSCVESDDKNQLRQQLRGVLSQVSEEELRQASAEICRRLAVARELELAPALAAYSPIQKEPQIAGFLEEWLAQGRMLYLPRYDATQESYGMVQVTSLQQDTRNGHYGIMEPLAHLPEAAALPEKTTWLVPGLAFSTHCARLGRGRGFYDRLLQRYPGGRLYGLCLDCQLLPALPTAPWDVMMDGVITPSRFICK